MKEAPKNVLMSGMTEANIPLQATLELTCRCNLKCVHCYLAEDTAGELSTTEVFSVIDQLVDAGTMEMNFTGGEALLRDDFFDIVEYARKRNMAVSLLSNGTLIDERAVAEMKRLHLSEITVSLYGATSEMHEGITRVPGSFAKTVNAIRLLHQSGVKVHANAMVMRQNVKEIAKLNDFCHTELGEDIGTDPHITSATDGSTGPLSFRLNDEELKEYLRWKMADRKDIKVVLQPCNAGKTVVAISAQGKVFPCLAMRLTAGDLRKEPFRRIWSDSAMLRWLRGLTIDDFRECRECKLVEACGRCQGASFGEEGSILARCRERCRITIIREEVRNEREKRPIGVT